MKPEEKGTENLVEINPENEAEPTSKLKKFGSAIVVGLIVAGMSAFGIIDFIDGGSDFVVKVEEKKVTPQAFSRFLDSQRKQYIYRFGSGIIEALLNKKEFVVMTANSMADQLLVAKALEDEGIVVNRDTVNYYIINSSQFKTVDGTFDKAFFKTYLSQLGVSEEEYILEQVPVIQTKFLLETLSLNDTTFQENLVRTLIASERQQREVLIKKIPIDDVINTTIEEKEILNYYIKNKENFTIPEKKIVTIGKIDESALENLPVSGQELIQEYNKQYLYKNQKISFYKLSFPSLEEAKFAENLIKKEGLAFTEVAKETLKLKASDIYFKNVQFSELAPEFSEELINLNKFEVTPVFYANGNYNILKVDSILNSKIPSFESVKAKLVASLKKKNSCPAVEALAEKLASELDTGEAIESGLKSIKLKQIELSGVSQSSLLPKSLEASILSDTDTSYGKVIKTSPCEYYAYHIKSIEPQSFKPIEEVTDIIIEGIKKEKVNIMALSKANRVLETFQVSGFAEDETITLSRENKSAFGKEILEQIFQTEEGEILPPVLSSNGKEFLIIKLNKVNRIDEAKIKESDVKQALKQIQTNQKDELLKVYLAKLREKYKVKINYTYLQTNE